MFQLSIAHEKVTHSGQETPLRNAISKINPSFLLTASDNFSFLGGKNPLIENIF